jgi:hypothetical protein
VGPGGTPSNGASSRQAPARRADRPGRHTETDISGVTSNPGHVRWCTMDDVGGAVRKTFRGDAAPTPTTPVSRLSRRTHASLRRSAGSLRPPTGVAPLASQNRSPVPGRFGHNGCRGSRSGYGPPARVPDVGRLARRTLPAGKVARVALEQPGVGEAASGPSRHRSVAPGRLVPACPAPAVTGRYRHRPPGP